MDKPVVHKIVKTTRRNFLDDVIKEKSIVPVAQFDLSLELINPKKRSNLSKSPRLTLPAQIEKIEKKE